MCDYFSSFNPNCHQESCWRKTKFSTFWHFYNRIKFTVSTIILWCISELFIRNGRFDQRHLREMEHNIITVEPSKRLKLLFNRNESINIISFHCIKDQLAPFHSSLAIYRNGIKRRGEGVSHCFRNEQSMFVLYLISDTRVTTTPPRPPTPIIFNCPFAVNAHKKCLCMFQFRIFITLQWRFKRNDAPKETM